MSDTFMDSQSNMFDVVSGLRDRRVVLFGSGNYAKYYMEKSSQCDGRVIQICIFYRICRILRSVPKKLQTMPNRFPDKMFFAIIGLVIL